MDFTLATPEKPKQRTMGVDGEHSPLDAVGQPRQQGPAQTDGCAGAQALGLPLGSVAEGDVDTFVRAALAVPSVIIGCWE